MDSATYISLAFYFKLFKGELGPLDVPGDLYHMQVLNLYWPVCYNFEAATEEKYEFFEEAESLLTKFMAMARRSGTCGPSSSMP